MRPDATPLMRLYARQRLRALARKDPVAEQKALLHHLVLKARATRFGRVHGFDHILETNNHLLLTAYRERVPVRTYEDFWNEWWHNAYPVLENETWPGRIPAFAVTSGTTSGTTKNIPVSAEMLKAQRRAALDVIAFHLAQRPDSRVFGGKLFMLGGSTDLERPAPGVVRGDLSALAVADTPLWVRPFAFPPRALALMQDWQEKVDVLARRSLKHPIRALSGTPSWLLILFERLAAHSGGGERLVDWYPELELLVHGGVNFAPYRQRFRELLAGSRAELREVFPASEGFFAVQDGGDGEGLRLLTDRGVFYEFIPVSELDRDHPEAHWLGDVHTDTDYALVVTTNAGLWRHVVGDTVRFVERHPPRIVVTGRTAYTLSAFGEHLHGEEIEGAVAAAADALHLRLDDFSVGPLYPTAQDARGGHLYVVEFAGGVPDADTVAHFGRRVDDDLQRTNDDYRTHRASDFGLAPPRVEAVPPGTFAEWMKARGRLGGQNKVPRVITDTALFDHLRRFAGV